MRSTRAAVLAWSAAGLILAAVAATTAGRHALKGVPGEWQLYAVESPL
jgi:hypothetical protein